MRHLLPLVLIALPTGAFADARLERMEEISSKMMDVMIEGMATEMDKEGMQGDKLRALAPAFVWDAEMRAAASCMVDAYIAKSSPEAVDGMLDTLEDLLPALAADPLNAMESVPSVMPAGMTEADGQKINEDCGMTALQMKQMQETGFVEIMMGGG